LLNLDLSLEILKNLGLSFFRKINCAFKNKIR